MEGIMDLLSGSMGKELISGIANQTGQEENKTADVLAMAMPLLVGAMNKNASSQGGADSLLNALNSKHNGSMLDNLGDLFSGGVNKEVLDDGSGILGHVLGNKQTNVENALSQRSGIDSGSIANILKIAAPLIMAYLGKQTAKKQVGDASGMQNLLGGLLNSGDGKNQSLLTSILDSDGDGSIIDDVAGMVMNKGKKKGGLGGMLGSLLD